MNILRHADPLTSTATAQLNSSSELNPWAAPVLDAQHSRGAERLPRVMARMLLDHFGTVRRVFTAEPDEIAAVRGFGPKTAEAIRAALDTPH